MTKMRTCRRCGRPALPGLATLKCGFHWAELLWGRAWALRCYPDHKDGETKAKPKPKRAKRKRVQPFRCGTEPRLSSLEE